MAQAADRRLQPLSMPTDDFVVMGSDSSGSSGGSTSPQDSSGPTSQVLMLNHHGSEIDVQQLANKIDQVNVRQTSLRSILSDNSGNLERLRGALTDRLRVLQTALVEREAELNVRAEQCSQLQVSNREMKTDLRKLQNQQEVWEQTIQDSHKLKNAYDLLTNTKERLQSERDHLKDRGEALAAETAKLRLKLDEDLRTALEAELIAHEATVQALRQELQTERETSLSGLKSKHQEAWICYVENSVEDSVRTHIEDPYVSYSVAGKDSMAEQQRQNIHELEPEIQRLKTIVEEMNRRCSESSKLMVMADQEKTEMRMELQEIQAQSRAQMETMEADAKVLEQKTGQEMQLRKRITEQIEQRRQIVDGHEQTVKNINQQLSHVEQQVQQMTIRAMQAEQQLRQTSERLTDSEKFASEMQSYSAGLETVIDSQKEQLVESSKKQYEAIDMAEQLQARFEEEVNRSASLDTELWRLKLDHTKLREAYSKMELSASRMQANDDETQLQQTERRLGQAEEAIDTLKGELEGELIRSANVESELSRRKLEHTKLCADYSEMEQSATRMLATEHELRTRQQQTDQRLRQAEEAIDTLNGWLQASQIEYEKLLVDRDGLKLRVNELIEALT